MFSNGQTSWIRIFSPSSSILLLQPPSSSLLDRPVELEFSALLHLFSCFSPPSSTLSLSYSIFPLFSLPSSIFSPLIVFWLVTPLYVKHPTSFRFRIRILINIKLFLNCPKTRLGQLVKNIKFLSLNKTLWQSIHTVGFITYWSFFPVSNQIYVAYLRKLPLSAYILTS